MAVEEPLEIRLGYGELPFRRELALAVTMRTPGEDAALAVGFLYSEGLIQRPSDLLSVKHCTRVEKPEQFGNVIRVELAPELQFDPARLQRNFYTSSSCGVCGKSSIEAVEQQCSFIPVQEQLFSSEFLLSLPDRLRAAQPNFSASGGIHAAGLFRPDGQLIVVHEDVGRHNAVDKVIGAGFQAGVLPEANLLLQVSGRASFELVQKAGRAGIAVLSAVGAPSSLAVQLAEATGITLLGFNKAGRLNSYTHSARIEGLTSVEIKEKIQG
ncbi:formate dehydrogenase family accessory protein FdhD [Nitritalea halalkaliphila LW7]|uniref:Sulfur carrier protein FdhD n=1 Tax=Nitritalea halalkaliphila LW7 TaxID=1189621 RepID=I5C3T7_9BACT|nr:formate dehydrogenase family accessory protein FdhD [Nitritalea halalkaliphila LW7]